MKISELRDKIATARPVTPLAAGYLPTPLYRHDSLSAETGLDFFVKREDRIDDLGCGNKYRRLAYMVPYAKATGADTLITVGSLPSNQCKAVEFFGKACGMNVHLIFGGDTHARPKRAQGNYLLTSLLNSDVSWFDYAPWERMNEQIELVCHQEVARGRKPFVIISGSPEWPGILGSVELGMEICEQMGAMAQEPLNLVMPSGSSGTCLGIAIAVELLDLPWHIYGVVIGENVQRMTVRIRKIRQAFSEHTGLKLDPEFSNITLWDKALGGGYDKPQSHEIETMAHVLGEHNLVLDLNYMVKAYIGLNQLKNAGYIDEGARVLLVHTGGHIGIFDENPALQAWIQDYRPRWVKGEML